MLRSMRRGGAGAAARCNSKVSRLMAPITILNYIYGVGSRDNDNEFIRTHAHSRAANLASRIPYRYGLALSLSRNQAKKCNNCHCQTYVRLMLKLARARARRCATATRATLAPIACALARMALYKRVPVLLAYNA